MFGRSITVDLVMTPVGIGKVVVSAIFVRGSIALSVGGLLYTPAMQTFLLYTPDVAHENDSR